MECRGPQSTVAVPLSAAWAAAVILLQLGACSEDERGPGAAHDAAVHDAAGDLSDGGRVRPIDAGRVAMPLADAGDASLPEGPRTRQVEVAIAKWYGNHAAALSITHDAAVPQNDPLTVEAVLARGLHMDYELVSAGVSAEEAEYITTVMLPLGFGLFGHGATHVNHDRLTYEDAFESASTNYQTLLELGIDPVAFAYPGGHGSEGETHRAIAAAGFLCARGHRVTSNPYIAADDETEPRNWYYLPDLVMESIDYMNREERINDTEDLIPYLDGALQRKAWIILTYHAIGKLNKFGFYERETFEADLDEIEARDFWPAPMDRAALYLMERATAEASVTWHLDDEGMVDHIDVFLADGLSNDRYVQPLTLLFDVPKSWLDQPLEIQGPDGRLPDQTARATRAALSFAPSESRYTIRLATTPFSGLEETTDADAGGDDAGSE